MKLYIATPINARQEPTMREKLVAAKLHVEMLKAILADDVAAETYCGKVLYRPYTNVLFINGYRKDCLRIWKDIESITIGKSKKCLCPDKWIDTEFFIIKLSTYE